MPTSEVKLAISYIRFSTSAQGNDGKDSFTRQTDAIEAALKKHGLVLDQEFHDWGRSAYHKRHIAEGGALHELRRLAVAGKLKGKVLCLENWDRAGRLQVTDAAPLLMDMLNNGVDLVVGAYGGEFFSKETVNANLFLLYRALDEMNRGFGESQRKSEMAKAKWKSRKKAIAEGEFKPLNSLPWWLENGKDSYVIKAGMKELIQRIFSLYLAGNGGQVIASKLNAGDGVPLPPNKNGSVRKNANGWHPTYIQNLIKNRALIGYYFKTDYKIFPPVISESDFYRANAKRKERVRFTGRKTEHINPFAGLGFCKCGGHIITHHSGVKKYGKIRYSYLMCGESRRGKCSAAGIPWEVCEESFSEIWRDKKMVKAFMGEDEKVNSKLPELEGRLAVIASQLRQVEADYQSQPSKTLAGIMAKLEADETAVKRELEAETITERGTVSQSEAWTEFWHIFAEDWDTPEIRLKVQECLRNMIERITFDIAAKSYAVQFKGGKGSMTVTELTAKGCKVNGVYRYLSEGVQQPHGKKTKKGKAKRLAA